MKIVIIVSMSQSDSTLLIEKWENAPVGQASSSRRSVRISNRPTCMQQLTVDLVHVRGGPLVVEFEKMFLREPVLPHEGDIVLRDEDLLRWADLVWNT